MRAKKIISTILCFSLIFNGFSTAFTENMSESITLENPTTITLEENLATNKASFSNILLASSSETNLDEDGYASTFEELEDDKEQNDNKELSDNKEATDTATASDAVYSEDFNNINEDEENNDDIITTASDSEASSAKDDIISTKNEIESNRDETFAILASISEPHLIANIIVSSKSELLLNENTFADNNVLKYIFFIIILRIILSYCSIILYSRYNCCL